MIYRIKPMEWEQHDHVHIAKTPVYEFRVGEHEEMVTFSISPAGPEMEHMFASSVEDGKDACRRWWETHALQLLEFAYRPSTDTPTEPGRYWWRRSPADRWEGASVGLGCNGDIMAGRAGDYTLASEMQGQWIRIPEPEVGP